MTHSFIPKHGAYEELLSCRKSVIVYDGTVCFCDRFMHRRDRTVDQMIQAARSGKQNILEGCMASATSKKSEIKLTNVARASLEELLEDYRDYLRVRGHALWPETVANILIRIIHQTNYLLDRQIRQLEKAFLEEGGLPERMTRARVARRSSHPEDGFYPHHRRSK